MSSYTLNLQVNGGEITSTGTFLTADSVDFVTAVFNFDKSWNELLKTAIFRVGEIVYHTPLENDCCKIPHEALKEPLMYISVFGVLDTVRATTTEIPIQVQNSGYVACEPSAPSPDPYNYFLMEVTDMKMAAEAAEASCDEFAKQVTQEKNEVSEMFEKVKSAETNSRIHAETAGDYSSLVVTACEDINRNVIYVRESRDAALESANKAFESSENATNIAMTEIENHNSHTNDLAHPNITEIANEAKVIALGKAASLCFDTEQQLKDWVRGEYSRPDGKTTNDLKVGDNLYVVELDVPDYWWDGSSIKPLGAEKPDFSDYYTKQQIDARLSNFSFELVERETYNSLYESGKLDAGKIYFVFEEE